MANKSTQVIEYVVKGTKEILEADKALEGLADATDTATEETEKFADEQNKTAKKVKGTSKAYSGIGDQLKSMANRFQIAGKGAGDLASGMFKSTKATGGLNKKMKLLKIAIAGTGIGVLVIALGALVVAFTKTEVGGDKLAKIMKQVGAVIDTIVGRLATFGEGLFKLITGADGGLKQMKESFNGVSKEIKGAVVAAGELADTQVKLRKINIEVTEDTARRSRMFQQELLISKDITKSADERREALRKAGELELANERDFVRLKKEELSVVLQELEGTPEALRNDEQRLEIAQARANLDNAIAQSAARQREVGNRNLELESRIRSEKAAAAAIQKAIDDAETKKIKEKEAKAEAERLKEQEALEQKKADISELTEFQLEQAGRLEEAELERRARLLDNEELTEEKRALIIAESEATITDIRVKSVDSEVAARQRGFNAIAALIVQGLGDTKAAAIFQTAITTRIAALEAFKAVVGIPVVGPTLAPIAAATAAAFGAKQIADIVKRQPPKFATGVIDLMGAGTATSDSIPAYLSRGESVMTAKETSDFKPTLLAIRKGEADADTLNRASKGEVKVIDNTRVIETTQVGINVDEGGFTSYQRKQNNILERRERRYSLDG